MSFERLRNVKTGEFRDVDTNTDEYAELINEVYDHDGSARPKWELTGQHHARRIDEGNIDEADLGYQFKPIPGAEVDVSEVGPELHPERAITDAEKEMGIDSYEQKLENQGVATATHPALRDAEPLERVAPEDRREEGFKTAGSASSKSKRGGNGSGKGGSGGSAAKSASAPSSSGSGSGSGSGSSGSGSSGSSSSGGGAS